MSLDRYKSDFGSLKLVAVLTTDWGHVQLPYSASAAYQDVRKNRFGLPDQRTMLGKRLTAYERRQLKLASSARGDFTPEEFA